MSTSLECRIKNSFPHFRGLLGFPYSIYIGPGLDIYLPGISIFRPGAYIGRAVSGIDTSILKVFGIYPKTISIAPFINPLTVEIYGVVTINLPLAEPFRR